IPSMPIFIIAVTNMAICKALPMDAHDTVGILLQRWYSIKLRKVKSSIILTAVFLAGMMPSGPRYLWYGPPRALSSPGVRIKVCGVNHTRKHVTMTKAIYFIYFVYFTAPLLLSIPHHR